MIKRLIWTIWTPMSSVLKKADKLNLSLSLRNVCSDWCETKRKCIGWILTLTFDLTDDLDVGCYKVKFRNSSISGIVGLIDMKWKGSELMWYWADCMTLPFDHTHDLDLGVEISRSRVWNGFISGMGQPIDMEQKGCESSMNDHDID